MSGTGTPPFTYQVLYRLTGTSEFTATPTTADGSVTVPNLLPFTQYDFQVISRNVAGYSVSPIVSAYTGVVPPSPALNVQATLVQATAITLSWQQPLAGTQPFIYYVSYWPAGLPGETQTLLVGAGALAVTIVGLTPNTTYDVEVLVSNADLL